MSSAESASSSPPRVTFPDQFRTPRALMRRTRIDDAPAVFRNWTSDHDVVRYLPWKRHATVADAAAYVASLVRKWDDGVSFAWMITMPPDDEPVGLALIRFRGDDAEIGYALARRMWGAGLASEVASDLLRMAFAVRSVHRVVALLDAENASSARVLEKIGMEWMEEFTDDTPHPNISTTPRPCWLYAVTRERWRGASRL